MPQADKQTPTYLIQIAPVLQSNCLACHSSATKMGGLVMETYDGLLKGGPHGPCIVPGKSEDSRLVAMLEGRIKPQMPFGGNPLPEADIKLIREWIDAGAPLGTGPTAGTKLSPIIPDIKPDRPEVSPVSAIAYSPDGKLLALGGYREVRLVDSMSGKPVATLGGHAGVVRGVAFSPDGTRLAAAGGLPAQSGEIKIWDVQSWKLIRTMEGHKDCIDAVAISPNGKLLASGSYDKLIKLWDVDTGQELKTLKDHIDAVFSLAFSPNGKLLASGAQDRSIKLWDVASGERLYTLSEPLDSISAVVFSPDGKQLAAAGADKVIRLWNLAEKSATLAQSFIGHEDTVLGLCYTPDGKHLISTSQDRALRFWDAATLTPIQDLEPQSDWVQAMSVSPDGKRLAVGRFDGTLSVYDLSSFKPVLGSMTAFEPLPAQNQLEAQKSASH